MFFSKCILDIIELEKGKMGKDAQGCYFIKRKGGKAVVYTERKKASVVARSWLLGVRKKGGAGLMFQK